MRAFFANIIPDSPGSVCPVENDDSQKLPPVEFVFEEVEATARALTVLVHAVNPAIDMDETFNLLVQACSQGMTEETATTWGKLIRMTSAGPGDPLH